MKQVLFFLFLSFLISCSTKKSQDPSTVLDGLIGKWDATGTAITEEWRLESEDSYKAKVTSHAGPVPEIQEYIEVKKEGDDWFFLGTVLHQNSGQAIRFKLTESSPQRLLFENDTHDFPQHIEYFLINKDKMKARVSGSEKGKEREFVIAYYRAKY